MTRSQLALLVASVVLLTPLWLALWQGTMRRRRRRRHQPFRAAWRMRLARDCALYRQAPRELRRTTELLAQEFLDEHRLVGCAGLRVTPAMARLVAFQACLLIARRGLADYEALGAVLLYPDAFLVEESAADDAGVVTHGSEPLSGQSIDTANIVLAWTDVQSDSPSADGNNVVIHEFAHFLDHRLDGALSEPDTAAARALLAAERVALRERAERGEPTLLDPYGSEDPAEFFAVASETFMELPQQLRREHPQLYAMLDGIYGLDPARWA
jgi:Mlc titration factor MtfA (ptsG expression regulator)